MNLQDATIYLLENYDSNINVVKEIAYTVRNKYVELKGGSGTALSGTCLNACDDLCEILTNLGYDISVIDGFAIFNKNLDLSEITYDYHSACYIIIDDVKYYLDVVADQFEYYISDLKNDIILQTVNPDWFVEDKPNFSRTNRI